MAIQILPQEKGLGAYLGEGLGSGLSSGLQMLAQQKLTELASRQQQAKSQQGFAGIGYTPQEAAALSLLPESLQKSYLANYGPLEQPMGLEQQLAGLGGAQGSPLAQQASAPGAITPEGVGAAPITQPAAPQRRLTREQEKQRKLEEYRENKLVQTEKLTTRKMVQKGVEEEIASGQRAQEILNTLGEMRELTAKGTLDHPGYLNALERLGLDYDVLKNPDTQVYQSLEKEFLRDLKPIFGGRITDAEMKQFLRSIPKATNTPEARNKIIDKLERLYSGKSLRTQVLQRLMDENNGEVPHNWKALVEKEVKPELDELAKEFKSRAGAYSAGQEVGLDSLRNLPSGSEAEDDEGNKYMVRNGVIFKKPTGGGWARMQ